jgi:hypothetical protein
VTLLLFWAASGWAMYVVTYAITREHVAAAVAMLVFTLAPPRIEYGVEFQMEIMFGLPLGVWALVRFLETQRLRHLLAFLVAFWLQAIAVWYFAVILGVGLVVLALGYALRRWSGWRPAAVLAAGAGGVALAAALAPVAWPFFVTRKELGLERAAADALDRSADVLTYLTTGGTWLAKLVRVSFVSETTLFPGLLALVLAATAAAWVRTERSAGARGGCVLRRAARALIDAVQGRPAIARVELRREAHTIVGFTRELTLERARVVVDERAHRGDGWRARLSLRGLVAPVDLPVSIRATHTHASAAGPPPEHELELCRNRRGGQMFPVLWGRSRNRLR